MNRLRRRDHGERLDRLCDPRVGEVVVAMPPVLLGRQEAARDELRELDAGGRIRDTGACGELAGRKRVGLAEGEQERGARFVSDQGGGGGDIGIGDNSLTLSKLSRA
jgi:hypothetical protein